MWRRSVPGSGASGLHCHLPSDRAAVRRMVGQFDGMELDVTGEVFYWRGPAPHHFVTVPDDESALIHELASTLTYGWGMIPVSARIGRTTFTTSLFPKNGGYLIPSRTPYGPPRESRWTTP